MHNEWCRFKGQVKDTVIDNITLKDHEIAAADKSMGGLNDLTTITGLLPVNIHIDALDYIDRTNVYFSLGESAKIGGTTYAEEDIIYWNGGAFAMAWDGLNNELPPSADVDALDLIATLPLEFSISLDRDAKLTVNSSPTSIADEDLVHFKTAAGFTAVDFDGSAQGVSPNVDLDGFNRKTATQWIMTFDSTGKVGALRFDDADVLQWNTGTSTFADTLFCDASAEGVKDPVQLTGLEATDGQVNSSPSLGEDICVNVVCIFKGQTIQGRNVGATRTDISSCGIQDDLDVWYCYTPSNTETTTIQTCGSDFDTTLAVFEDCPTGEKGAANQIACNDDACGLQLRITTNLIGGVTYYVRVFGFSSATGSFQVTILSGPLPTPTNTTVGAPGFTSTPTNTPIPPPPTMRARRLFV